MNAVEFENVSKSYSIYESPGDRLRELATFGRRAFHRDFLALRDLTFTIRRGEVFCFVGENGSGKSTALQLIAGISPPSSGRVRVNGRVSALLELGAGFNPEFSGRENVWLNGALMGFSRREMEARWRAIEEFAEIGDFIRQPVKTYSSGMVVRLAFAVAIHVDPEILLVDEALAVGDTYFRHKCMRKVHELRARGLTIVFVSHSSADILAIGDRVLWLDHGRMIELGDAEPVLTRYLAAMSNEGKAPAERNLLPEATAVEPLTTIPNIDHRHGDGRIRIQGIVILNEFAEPVHLMLPDSRLLVRMTIHAESAVALPTAGFLLRNHLGFDFAEAASVLPALAKGELRTVDLLVELPEFYPGAFSFSPYLREKDEICDWIDNAITVQMAKGDGPVYGYVQVPCRIELDPAARGVHEGEPTVA